MTTIPPDISALRINRDAPRATSGSRWKAWLLGVAVLVIAGVAFALLRAPRAIEVQVAPVSVTGGGAGSSGISANGYVVARTKASVSAKIAGRLEYLGVTEGSHVRQGEVIARIESNIYRAELQAAKAQITEAQAQLVQARRDLERAKKLRDQGVIATSDLENAQTKVDVLVASLDNMIAQRKLAEANVENTLVRAPFDGTVLRKDAEVGEVVAPSVGGGLTRGAVVTMADFSTLEVEVDVNEAYIARIRQAAPARITLDAYPDTTFRGSVRQVVPTADRQRATVQVKVSILDRDPRILPEMGARVDFLSTDTVPAAAGAPRIRVPAAAVRQENGKTVVWLVREERLERREVDAGPVSGGFREIRRGLAGGELLLTGGVDEPRAGMRVKAKSP